MWVGYNPNIISDPEFSKLLNELLEKKYLKLSYFFICPQFQGNLYGKQFLSIFT